MNLRASWKTPSRQRKYAMTTVAYSRPGTEGNRMKTRTPFAYIVVAACASCSTMWSMIGANRVGAPLGPAVLLSFGIVVATGYVLHGVFTFRQPLALRALVSYALAMSANVPLAFITTWFWRDGRRVADACRGAPCVGMHAGNQFRARPLGDRRSNHIGQDPEFPDDDALHRSALLQDILSVHLAMYRRKVPYYQATMLESLRNSGPEIHRRLLDVGGGTGVIAQAMSELLPVEEVQAVDWSTVSAGP